MTLPEAIEIKERQKEGYTTYSKEVIDEADRLSIEAMKRIHDRRQSKLPGYVLPLIGETGYSEKKSVSEVSKMSDKYDQLEKELRKLPGDKKIEFLGNLSIIELSTLASHIGIDTMRVCEGSYNMMADALTAEVIMHSTKEKEEHNGS